MTGLGGLILSLAVFSAAPARAAAAPAGDLARVRQAAQRGSPSGAFDIAVLSLGGNPEDRELLLLATELMPENSPARARRLAAAAAAYIVRHPQDYAGYVGACKSMRALHNRAEALTDCRKALEADPTAYPPYRELGFTYAAAGSPREAAETLEQGVEISSTSFQARYYLGRLMEKRGNTVRALASYRKALALARASRAPDAPYYLILIRSGLKRAELSARKPLRRRPGPRAKTGKEGLEACKEKFREEFLKDSLGTALRQSDSCLKLSPSDPDLAAQRAPLMVRLGKYEEGVKEYERAAALYGPKNPAYTLCRTKAAETWLKLGSPAGAIEQYKLALEASPKDLEVLKGLAAAQDSVSDIPGAMATYSAITALEPQNDNARTRLEELKDASLTDDQILAELKLRGAADQKETGLDPDAKGLFRAITAAELAGAVDYLHRNAPDTRGVYMRHDSGGRTRLLLTGDGYKLYVSLLTRDAIKFFEKEGLDFRTIFQLRTEKGDPVFDKNGRLTPEGEELYRAAVPGKKTWLLPAEPVPASPQARASEEAEKEIAALRAKGYEEISEPEYLWLLSATRCPESTLKSSPVNAVVQLFDGARQRYLLCFDANSLCKNGCNDKLSSFIAAYRNNDAAGIGSDGSTAFFGTGGVKHNHFCEGGEVWMGGTDPSDSPCRTGAPPKLGRPGPAAR